MAHLGRRLRGSASVIDRSQLPSASLTSSYHLNHSDSTLSIRVKLMEVCQNSKILTHLHVENENIYNFTMTGVSRVPEAR